MTMADTKEITFVITGLPMMTTVAKPIATFLLTRAVRGGLENEFETFTRTFLKRRQFYDWEHIFLVFGGGEYRLVGFSADRLTHGVAYAYSPDPPVPFDDVVLPELA